MWQGRLLEPVARPGFHPPFCRSDQWCIGASRVLRLLPFEVKSGQEALAASWISCEVKVLSVGQAVLIGSKMRHVQRRCREAEAAREREREKERERERKRNRKVELFMFAFSAVNNNNNSNDVYVFVVVVVVVLVVAAAAAASSKQQQV